MGFHELYIILTILKISAYSTTKIINFKQLANPCTAK